MCICFLLNSGHLLIVYKLRASKLSLETGYTEDIYIYRCFSIHFESHYCQYRLFGTRNSEKYKGSGVSKKTIHNKTTVYKRNTLYLKMVFKFRFDLPIS